MCCCFSSYTSFTESYLKLYKEDPATDCPNPLISKTSMSVTSHNASEVCLSHDFSHDKKTFCTVTFPPARPSSNVTLIHTTLVFHCYDTFGYFSYYGSCFHLGHWRIGSRETSKL